ncbi:MAG: hypothetical protein LDL33_00100 [Desulfomonile sp.]|nr:hypothetical protein [Desulfomonile sp.]
MAEPTYCIKLYGHTSADPETFRKNLAMILGIDGDSTRSLLQDLPAVIMTGLPKERAEAVCEALTLIKALTIMEPEGEPGGGPPPESIPRAGRGPATGITWEGLEEEPLWTPWVRPVLAIAAGLLVLIVLAAVLRPSYRVEKPAPPPERVIRPAQPPSETQERHEYLQTLSIEQLEAEGERLAMETRDLQQQLKLRMEEVARLYSTYGVNEEELSRRRLEVKQLRNQLRRHARDMRVIMFRIQALERAAARAAQQVEEPPPEETEATPAAETEASTSTETGAGPAKGE